MADNFKRDKFGFKHQPMGQQGIVGNPLAGFTPDVIVVIKTESSTGRTVIETGNGIPLNPLNIISLCLSVAKGNMDAYLRQAGGIVDPSKSVARNERTADNPPHNFVPCDDNAEICSYCASHKDNHTKKDNGSN